jgi:hypothetical protein
MSGMPLALITTGLAGRRAGLDYRSEDAKIRRGLTDRDPGGSAAGVGAVEAEANAAHHLVHVVLREIGVGATRAAGGALEALFDTAQECVVIDTCRLWMRLDYVLNRHVLSSLGRSMNTIWKLPRFVFDRPLIVTWSFSSKRASFGSRRRLAR